MRKVIIICDICGKEIRQDEPVYIRPGLAEQMDLCAECRPEIEEFFKKLKEKNKIQR